jgi:hypothetical protein
MPQTTYQQIEKPLDRESLLELFLQSRFEEIGAIFGNAYVEGLQLEWVSVSSVKVKTGAADLPDGSRRLRVTSDITVSSISLGSNAWGHVYLYNNAGAAAVEVVTTAPAAYFGSAYQKTGVSTRRYLGTVRTNASGQIYNFLHVLPNFIRYRENLSASPFRVLTNGVATSVADVDLSAVVPVTSRLAHLRMKNTSATASVLLGSSDGVTPAPTGGSAYGGPGDGQVISANLNSSRVLKYIYDAAPTNGAYMDVWGYWFDR